MNRFNLRVYAIIRNDNKEILVSDERRGGVSFTKFPGGGLEWGEGLQACLQREIKEELNLSATIGALFYVNDFFQESAFRKEDQLLSFYYWATPEDLSQIVTKEHPIPLIEEGEAFRWVPQSSLHADLFTFPIDKVVAQKLLENCD